ncbi:hypothetical protein M6B38_263130 [Iris pallida]|uniref:Uncharacterized protein n=1 Tax=Iris pallida TaxID=29817 RepID=A0AAX6HSE3_IRIPA|nr:hypothetical protein M6B38_295320 [Iris pallida]KAJ6850723.1 hypothetical protein M6B38_263130 [Iris pallida]
MYLAIVDHEYKDRILTPYRICVDIERECVPLCLSPNKYDLLFWTSAWSCSSCQDLAVALLHSELPWEPFFSFAASIIT